MEGFFYVLAEKYYNYQVVISDSSATHVEGLVCFRKPKIKAPLNKSDTTVQAQFVISKVSV